MFKVNNKNTRKTSMMSFWCFYCYPVTYFIAFSSVSIVEFEDHDWLHPFEFAEAFRF